MRTVADVLDGIYHLVDIQADETVLAASWKMVSARVGALLIMRYDDPVGIFSERDVLTKVVGMRRDPAETLVLEVMSRPVIHVFPHTTLGECRQLMGRHRIRHLPVFCDDTPLAMLSLRDVLDIELADEHDGVGVLGVPQSCRLH